MTKLSEIIQQMNELAEQLKDHAEWEFLDDLQSSFDYQTEELMNLIQEKRATEEFLCTIGLCSYKKLRDTWTKRQKWDLQAVIRKAVVEIQHNGD